MEFNTRNSYLIGEENCAYLAKVHVAIFGVGGVGSFVCEALVRTGIEELSLIDFDKIDVTNLNRQIMTNMDNINKVKVEEIKDRCMKINPNLKIHTYPIYFESEEQLDFSQFDYMVDAIDHVSSKLELLRIANTRKIPFIMSLGTARKLNPQCLKVSKLSKTEMDPLAKKIRTLARKEHLGDCKVVYSSELALPSTKVDYQDKLVNGSMIFVPATAGLLIAQQVVMDLISKHEKDR